MMHPPCFATTQIRYSHLKQSHLNNMLYLLEQLDIEFFSKQEPRTKYHYVVLKQLD